MILTRQPASSNSRRNVAVNSVRGQVINSHQRRRAGEGWELTARLPLQTKQWKKLNFRIQPRHERCDMHAKKVECTFKIKEDTVASSSMSDSPPPSKKLKLGDDAPDHSS